MEPDQRAQALGQAQQNWAKARRQLEHHHGKAGLIPDLLPSGTVTRTGQPLRLNHRPCIEVNINWLNTLNQEQLEELMTELMTKTPEETPKNPN